jgi:hypothetical protein
MSRWLDMRADVADDICFQIDELIEGYALGSLETDELLLVSDHIDGCPEAAERLRNYEETVGLLGLAVPATTPSPALWMRLEGATRPVERPANVRELKSPATSGIVLPRWAAGLASVAAVFLLAATISLGVALQRSEDDGAPVTDETVAEYLMSGGEMMQLSSWAAPEWMTWPGRGTLITAPDMPPIVMVDKCAPTGDTDWDYVVWLRVGDERTLMGQMEISEEGKGIIQLEGVDSIENYDAIGISIRKNSTVYDVMEGSPGQSG